MSAILNAKVYSHRSYDNHNTMIKVNVTYWSSVDINSCQTDAKCSSSNLEETAVDLIVGFCWQKVTMNIGEEKKDCVHETLRTHIPTAQYTWFCADLHMHALSVATCAILVASDWSLCDCTIAMLLLWMSNWYRTTSIKVHSHVAICVCSKGLRLVD